MKEIDIFDLFNMMGERRESDFCRILRKRAEMGTKPTDDIEWEIDNIIKEERRKDETN